MFQIFSFLRWSLEALARGRFPLNRHDGLPFGEDDRREGLAGTELAFKGALVFVKADWSELVTSFGIPVWNDSIRPCPCCNCSLDNMYAVEDGGELDDLEWRPNMPGDYNAACARCEVIIILDRGSHALIESSLAIVPLKGSVLLRDILTLGLVRGDRLEPCAWLHDVQTFDMIESFPHPCMFWRASEDTNARHRNPLFDTDENVIGITAEDSITVDTLHALYLGSL